MTLVKEIMDAEVLLISVNEILEKYKTLPEDVELIEESLINEIAEEIANSMSVNDDFDDIVEFMNEVDLGKWSQ